MTPLALGLEDWSNIPVVADRFGRIPLRLGGSQIHNTDEEEED
jgi:hypothetical protein